MDSLGLGILAWVVSNTAGFGEWRNGSTAGGDGTQVGARFTHPAAPSELWGSNLSLGAGMPIVRNSPIRGKPIVVNSRIPGMPVLMDSCPTLQIYGRTSSKTLRARRFPSRG